MTSGAYRGTVITGVGPSGSVHFFFAMSTMPSVNVLCQRLAELARPFIERPGASSCVDWKSPRWWPVPARVVRVYLDGPQGVDVEQCAQVSRQLGLALDVEDIIHGAYQLEVSSPGLSTGVFFDVVPAPARTWAGKWMLTLAEPLATAAMRFKGIFTWPAWKATFSP